MNPQVIICSLALVLFVALSHPLELRRWRWLKIIFSLPLVWIVSGVMLDGLSQGGVAGIILFVALVFLWRSNISHFISQRIIQFLHGRSSPDAGFRPDFRGARAWMRERNWLNAQTAIGEQLKIDPRNYEGLMLLAEVLQAQHLPEEAQKQLNIVLNNPAATDAQKERARAEQMKCEQLQRHLEATGERRSRFKPA